MPRNSVIAVVAALLCTVVSLPASSARAAAAAAGPYAVTLHGQLGDNLRTLLLSVSKLYARRREKSAGAVSVASLRRRAEDDRGRFRVVLRSQGYYDGAVRYRIDPLTSPVEVGFEIQPGVPYLLSRFAVHFKEPRGRDVEARADKLTEAAPVGGRAVAEPILSAEKALLADFRREGFPFAQMLDRKAVVDHATRTLAVDLTLSLGRRATFGEVRIEGDAGLRDVFVRRQLTWTRGEVWNADRIESSRKRLADTGLFASIRIRHAASLQADGSLPVIVSLQKAKHRLLGAGLRYSSTDGRGLKLFWEHRNLLGGGERLRAATTVSDLEQSASVAYREPDFLSPNQVLLVDSGYVREATDAFTSRKFTVKASAERKVSSKVSVRAGTVVERSRVEQSGSPSQDFLLVGLPFLFKRSTANDLLNPTRGSRAELTVAPYLKGLGSDVEFYSVRLTDALYVPLDRAGNAVLAARASLGSLSGAGLAEIPADKRLYAGGGGSVRGYGFQRVGPLDADGDPTGGLSLLEVGTEFRVRIHRRWGLVPFVEGGNVFGESLPDFGRPLFWGAGLGLRWFTSVGPVRLDVAFPLNRRPGIDDAFQLYVSLGQSF